MGDHTLFRRSLLVHCDTLLSADGSYVKSEERKSRLKNGDGGREGSEKRRRRVEGDGGRDTVHLDDEERVPREFKHWASPFLVHTSISQSTPSPAYLQ